MAKRSDCVKVVLVNCVDLGDIEFGRSDHGFIKTSSHLRFYIQREKKLLKHKLCVPDESLIDTIKLNHKMIKSNKFIII